MAVTGLPAIVSGITRAPEAAVSHPVIVIESPTIP